MCFGQVFDFLFGGGGREKVVQQVNTPAPAAAPPPAASATAPTPDTQQSAEMEKASADRTGFSALIIPRTAFPEVNRSVPTG